MAHSDALNKQIYPALNHSIQCFESSKAPEQPASLISTKRTRTLQDLVVFYFPSFQAISQVAASLVRPLCSSIWSFARTQTKFSLCCFAIVRIRRRLWLDCSRTFCVLYAEWFVQNGSQSLNLNQIFDVRFKKPVELFFLSLIALAWVTQ